MTIKEIAAKHGISNRELARQCGIPIRTVENWSGGQATPPEYILTLIAARLRTFGVIVVDTDGMKAEALKVDYTALKDHMRTHRIIDGYIDGDDIIFVSMEK